MATKLNVRVKRNRPESMTRQIREQLNDLIERGELIAGTLLPIERELANTLNVARKVRVVPPPCVGVIHFRRRIKRPSR